MKPRRPSRTAGEKTDKQIARELRMTVAAVKRIRRRALEKIKTAILEDPSLLDVAMEICGYDVAARFGKGGQ